MVEWPSSALRMRTTNHILESSVDWSLYSNIKNKKKMLYFREISSNGRKPLLLDFLRDSETVYIPEMIDFQRSLKIISNVIFR